MVKSCALKNCKVEWNPLLNVGFHSFPVSNKELFAKWIKSIPKDLLPHWTKNSRICSKHFEKNCYYESSCTVRKQLKKDAVPTIFKGLGEREGDANNFISKTNLSSSFVDSSQSIINSSNDAGNVNCYRNIPDLRTIRKINVAVQVENRYLPASPEKAKLQKEIKMLQQRLKRRDEALTALKLLVVQIKNYKGTNISLSE